MEQLGFNSTDKAAVSTKKLFIKDLTAGQALTEFIIGLKAVNELKDKNSNIYYGLELVDSSGSMKAKIWSDSLDSVERKALAEGRIVRISGNVSEFRGEKQIVIYDLFEAKPTEYNLNDIIHSSRFDIEEMFKEIMSYVEKIEDTQISKILNSFFDKYAEEYKSNPAAERLHHAYRGGLMEHVLELLNYMDSMKKFYTEVNYDLVTAGIILHDAGKIRELKVDGFVNSRTDVGKLKGHLIMSYDILNEFSGDTDEKTIKKLQHIILSHHGRLEYGSPVVPKTLEAIMVHQLDELSASVRQYKRVIEESAGSASDFSQKDWALNTDVYLQ